jgi:hypothetical protein
MITRPITMIAVLAAVFVAGLSFAPQAHGDSNCSTAAACLTSFDDANPGDNQGGDSGAEREPPDNQRK